MNVRRLLLVALAVALAAASPALLAQITPDQRKEVAAVGKDLSEAAKLIRRKNLDEAETLVDAAEAKLEVLVADGVPPNDRMIALQKRNVALRRRAIALGRGAKPEDLGVSFSKDVAPIIQEHCLGCHGADNPKAGLRLDTFAGWKAGGNSKAPLLFVGNPRASALALRLIAPPAQRMPKDQPPLANEDVQTIARWITEGAKFDGSAETAPIGEMEEKDADGKKIEPEPVMIAKPTGGETVSFVKDVAPVFVNICGQCHAGANPRGGYSMATFEGIMRGGDSGQVIEPGKEEESRLWLMVSNKEQPRMPPGQLRVTRTFYDALTTWIKEGAKFDGDDPKKPLRELVPSMAQTAAAGLSKLSPAEFVAHRKTRSEEQWALAFPKTPETHVESDEAFVYGNVSEPRLKEVAGWADAQAAALRTMFAAESKPLFKGKLTVFVVKDRFGYEEFSMVVDRRGQVPAELHGHAVVTPDYDNVYVVLEDVGDAASATNPGLKANLADQTAQAYLRREGAKTPNLVVQGTGLYLAGKAVEGNPYFGGLRTTAAEAVKTLRQPEQVFADGTFPPGESTAVGYAVVDYLITNGGGQAKFGNFLAALAKDGDFAAAARAAYRAEPAALATAFLQNLSRRGR